MKIKNIIQIITFFLLFSCPLLATAGLNITPNTQEELINILKGLANDHAYKQWCDNDCGQIHQIKLSGKINDGTLSVTIKGHIIGKHNGVLPLFGAVPAIEFLSLKNGLQEVPLVFYNKSYYTLLAPGPFHLSGKIKINPKASTNFTLPGSVGEITLDIPDQEPLLKQVKQGQVGGHFQIVSAIQKESVKDKEQEKQNLRLNVKRLFKIGRDKSFAYTIDAVGARSGQVITFPLDYQEKVLEATPQNAKISSDKVDFTATGSENRFMLQGEWTQKDIQLKAPEGTIQETWSVDCQGAHDCLFIGEVEKSVTASGHEWIPLANQKLTVTWKELELLKGQSLVAQTAVLNTKYLGDGLTQTLSLDLASSAATQVYLALPETAIPTSLKYGDTVSPILKNKEGLVHLSIQKGKSLIHLGWEIPKTLSNKIPLPDLKLPTGKWIFWATPNKNKTPLFTGGPTGNPVVKFWSRMLFCLFMGGLFLFAERKLVKTTQTKIALFLIMCAGYALTGPGAVLGIISFIAVIRLLAHIKTQRTIFGWLFEGGLLLILIGVTISTFLFILNTAFFSKTPFQFENYCSTTAPIAGLYIGSALCWETVLSQPGQPLVAPYVMTIPTLAIRIIYFIWALAVGYFLFIESKNLWSGVKNYYKIGMKPIFKKK